MPNFCPECGSSQATSRFCSSCGYSLAAIPAPPDASTRVEDTPVFRPFAPPVAETWESLAADPWGNTAGAMSPPPVRNVVTQTPVDMRSYQRERLIKKLGTLRLLWGVVLIGVVAYGVVEFFSIVMKSFLSTETRSTVLGVLGLVLFVAWPAMAGVAASASRQAGARTPHPALVVLLVVGAGFLTYVLGRLISPDLSADTEAVLLLSDTGGERQFRYGFALLLSGFFVYTAALSPVVALSKALKDRYPDDPLYMPANSGQDAAPTLYESVHVGWWRVLLSALILGTFDVITAGTFGLPDRFTWHLGYGFALGGVLGFLEKNMQFNKPIVQAVDTPTAEPSEPSEPRGFWVRVFWWCFFVIGSFAAMFLLLLLIGSLAGDFG